MAVCPCGCGMKVRRGTGGAAKALKRLLAMRSATDEFLEVALERVHEDDRETVSTTMRLRDGLHEVLLAHLHGTASPGQTPTLLEAHRAQQAYETDVQMIMDAFR